MPQTVTRPSGLQIRLPDTFAAPEESIGTSGRRSFAGGRLRADEPLSGASDGVDAALLRALGTQEMQIVDDVTLPPTLPATPLEGRRGAALPFVPEHQEIELTLPVSDTENALVLLEQDGLYSWHFPTDQVQTVLADDAGGRRGARESGSGTRNLSFRIPVTAEPTPASEEARRGFFAEMVYGRVRAVVLKFVFDKLGDIAVTAVMKRLESRFSRGLRLMKGDDVEGWEACEDLTTLKLPTDRPARLLLFFHGTFSSTIGSFGGLCTTEEGRRFLEGANARYDAVVGFDHPTLSEDPLQNASDLLERLRQSSDLDLQFDVIAYSRGGLVLRSLVELLLPGEEFQPHFQSAVFVAVTNGGTQLALPDNWHRLADLYVNLAAGAAQGLAVVAPGNPLSLILNETMQGLGAFVKYLSTHATTEKAVPGLAAMMPGGDFIQKLNESQAELTGEPIKYAVITSQFSSICQISMPWERFLTVCS